MRIAIDGPASSGKGTLAKKISEKYGLPYLNTGALYRAVAFDVINQEVDPENEEMVVELAKKAKFDNLDSSDLYNEIVGAVTSKIAKIQRVRDVLFDYQVNFANQKEGAVLDGRDIGTVICPNADFKFFIVASVQVRAERRYKELKNKGKVVKYEEILQKLKDRDKRDSERKNSPMKPAADAIIVDTSDLDIEQVFEKVVSIIEDRK